MSGNQNLNTRKQKCEELKVDDPSNKFSESHKTIPESSNPTTHTPDLSPESSNTPQPKKIDETHAQDFDHDHLTINKTLKIKDNENFSLHKSQTELPRYFTRSKRRREEGIDQENERYHKIARAFLSRSLANEIDADNNVADHSFPADVIAGIRIPKTYSEAISDPEHSKKWKDAMLQEIIGLSENGTWKEVIPLRKLI